MSFVTGGLTNPDALVAMDAVAVSDAVDTAVNRVRVARFSALKGTAAAVLPGGGKYYVSGQAKNGPLPEAVKGTLASLEKTLTYLGLDKSRVVQMKAFMQPISAADSVQAEIAKFFEPDLPPPTVFVEWNSPTNTPIEIELIASDFRPAAANGNSVDFLTPPDLAVSKVFSRVAHVNYGSMIYFSSFYGNAPGPAATQLNDIYIYLDNFLPRVGTDFDHLVKATYYVTDDDASAKLNDIRPKFYNPQRPPAASKAMVKGVGLTERTVTVDLIGVTK
jgi:enamine deaminase RidA (YjgF/YER057c/UK114 family)